MTISEAIAWLEAERGLVSGPSKQNRTEAIQLGVEALKRIEERRRRWYIFLIWPLPGETIE